MAILRTYGNTSVLSVFISFNYFPRVYIYIQPRDPVRPIFCPRCRRSFTSTPTIFPPPPGPNQPREMAILFRILFHFTSQFTEHTFPSGRIFIYINYVYPFTDRIGLNPRKDVQKNPNTKPLMINNDLKIPSINSFRRF